MKRIRVSTLAERDLDHSMEIANGVVASITVTFPLFAGNPEAGTRRDEIELGVRGFPVGKYIGRAETMWLSRESSTECATKNRHTSRMRSDDRKRGISAVHSSGAMDRADGGYDGGVRRIVAKIDCNR